MKIGYIGLGKMGYNMVERLLEKGYEVVVFDQHAETVSEISKKGASGVATIANLVEALPSPRVVWLMVPHEAVDGVIHDLQELLSPEDTLIDGGNSLYTESIRHSQDFFSKKIHFLDAGISGGPKGARNGACVMVGGERAVYDSLVHLFTDIAANDAVMYTGSAGSGHFVKMVHNGVEYGMMQAIGEGFTVLKNAPFPLDLTQIATLYNKGSVIESRLIGWLHDALVTYGNDLEKISGSVNQSGEGEWAVKTAEKLHINVPIIKDSVVFRSASQLNPSFTGKIVSAIRGEFGGHSVEEK